MNDFQPIQRATMLASIPTAVLVVGGILAISALGLIDNPEPALPDCPPTGTPTVQCVEPADPTPTTTPTTTATDELVCTIDGHQVNTGPAEAAALDLDCTREAKE